MSPGWPEPDELGALLQRIREGDRVAPSDFIVAVLDPLVAHLGKWKSREDEHLYQTAAEDAILAFLRNPSSYNPEKSNLISYLRMAAERDLLNALAKELRHHRNRDSLDCVELPAAAGKNSEDDLRSFDDPEIAAVVATFTDAERAVLELMKARERRTAAYAPLLGVQNLSVVEQEREVKKVKDRITKRLERAGGSHE